MSHSVTAFVNTGHTPQVTAHVDLAPPFGGPAPSARAPFFPGSVTARVNLRPPFGAPASIAGSLPFPRSIDTGLSPRSSDGDETSSETSSEETPRPKVRVYNHLSSCQVDARVSPEKERGMDRITELYSLIQETMGRERASLTINISHQTVTYEEADGTIRQSDLKRLCIEHGPEFTEHVSEMRELAQVVWGETLFSCRDYGEGRKGVLNSSQPSYRNANDSVLAKLPKTPDSALKLAFALYKNAYPGAFSTLQQQEFFQEDVLKKMGAVETWANALFNRLDQTIQDLKGHYPEPGTPPDVQADIRHLERVKKHLKQIDYFAIAMAILFRTSSQATLGESAESILQEVSDLYQTMHDEESLTGVNTNLPGFVPGAIRGERQNLPHNGFNYAADVAGLVFSTCQAADARAPYARFCHSQKRPVKDGALEDDLIQLAFDEEGDPHDILQHALLNALRSQDARDWVSEDVDGARTDATLVSTTPLSPQQSQAISPNVGMDAAYHAFRSIAAIPDQI